MQKFFNKSKLKNWLISSVSVVGVAALTFGLTFGLGDFSSKKELDGITTTDTTSYVKVDEIYKGDGKFDLANFSKLMQYVSGDTSASPTNMAPISTQATNVTTADTMRTRAVLDKTAEQDIVVRLGGLDWTVTYLSTDKNGNPILTLWLTNNEQAAWQEDENIHKTDAGEYYGFAHSSTTNKYGLYSDWARDWYSSTTKDGTAEFYPSAMYGTSYIRSVTLNNGGQYATSNTALATDPGQDANNVFAKFTMSSVTDSLTNYLVKPVDVSWQENQSAKESDGQSYKFPNDEWNPTDNTGYYNASYNYAEHNGYDTWKNDYIWLPSLTETGYNNNSGTSAGLWQASIKQRQNYNGSTTSFTSTKIGSKNSNYATTAYTYSWLRSGGSGGASSAYVLNPSGSFGNNFVNFSLAVRPALHLNLKTAAEASIPTNWIELADTSWESANAGTESDPYIINTPEKLAGIAYLLNTHSSPSSGNGYVNRYFKQTANIDLTDYDWTPIGLDDNFFFVGNYDGNGFSIKNLTINSDEYTNAGLFGVAKYGAKISNVNLANAYIKSTKGGGYAGGIAGKIGDPCQITNCLVSGEIEGGSSTGGIVGYYQNSGTSSTPVITNCVSNCNVTGSWTGGIIGSLSSGASLTINCCVSNGKIEGGNNVVGIIGLAFGGLWSETTLNISKCIVNGTITAPETSNASIGAFAGTICGTKISNSFANCSLIYDNSTATRKGLFAGDAEGGINIVENCVFVGNNVNKIENMIGTINSSTFTFDSCYAFTKGCKQYTDGDFSSFGVDPLMNGGLPIQRALFWDAEFAPDVDIAVDFAGWTKI